MRDDAHRYVIAYDIVDDRRRNHVAKVLQSYGVRVQYSVFLIDLRPAKLVRLRMKLLTLINPGEDSVMRCDLGAVSRITPKIFGFLGVTHRSPETGPQII
ncbi:MAG: CRISPR-associated endonuclease Cas2 [Microbacteriaceae bacterium]|jgi:CRISPR-associated protein Cas2|nr:CRISPR-associated endonuclease Cas2 [Microbacteriaceae bacterium]